MFSPLLVVWLVGLCAVLCKKCWMVFNEIGGKMGNVPRRNPLNFGAALNLDNNKTLAVMTYY